MTGTSRLSLAPVVVRQEGRAHRVAAVGRQREVDDLTQERVGDLREDAGAVAGVHLGTDRPAVLEVAQRSQRELDDVVATFAAHGGHEGHPTGIVLVGTVVQTRGGRSGPEALKG